MKQTFNAYVNSMTDLSDRIHLALINNENKIVRNCIISSVTLKPMLERHGFNRMTYPFNRISCT